jgi:hypothetical protein
MVVFAVLAFLWLLVGGMVFMAGERSIQMFWGPVFVTIGAVLIFINTGPRVKPFFTALILAAALVDVIGAGYMSYHVRPFQEVAREYQPLIDLLEATVDRERLYSPSYSVPQDIAAREEWQLTDGVDPLQIEDYASFMTRASGVPDQGYSVTLPPFENGDSSRANRNYRPDPHLLGLLNTKWIISAFPIEDPALKLIGTPQSLYVYENQLVYPRAWLLGHGKGSAFDLPDPGTAWDAEIEILEYTSNRIIMHTRDKGLLVVSEIDYPGWQVRIDGVRQEIENVAGVLRGVSVDEGSHEVIWVFRPTSVYIGLGLGMAGIILSLVMWIRGKCD